MLTENKKHEESIRLARDMLKGIASLNGLAAKHKRTLESVDYILMNVEAYLASLEE